MKELQDLLDQAFTPVFRDSQTAEIRRARYNAVRLAPKHGIRLEHDHRYKLEVHAPEGCASDPWAGNPHCADWADALERIKHYAGIKE